MATSPFSSTSKSEESAISVSLLEIYAEGRSEWLMFEWMHVDCFANLLQLACMLPQREDHLRNRITKFLLDVSERFGSIYAFGYIAQHFKVDVAFRDFLLSKGFVGIHKPKLMGGSGEGGSTVFILNDKGKPVCLAHSPQLHKQMVICGGFRRIFEVGSVFRAEDSFTRRHLCEFVGLDVEMRIRKHYYVSM